MHEQFVVTPQTISTMSPASEPAPSSDPTELLRQLLEVQREQLALQRTLVAAHDHGSRWRHYLTRWQQEFPELPEACRVALPILERSYGAMLAELADHLRQGEDDALDNEFVLGEFLDRYGMRLSQLGTILSLVAFLAEAASANANAAGGST